jgi:hypothetical protein
MQQDVSHITYIQSCRHKTEIDNAHEISISTNWILCGICFTDDLNHIEYKNNSSYFLPDKIFWMLVDGKNLVVGTRRQAAGTCDTCGMRGYLEE